MVLRSSRAAARIPCATLTLVSTIVPAMIIRRIEVTATRVSNTAVAATYIMGPNTEDALLICHKDRTQDVKQVVDYLRENGNSEYL